MKEILKKTIHLLKEKRPVVWATMVEHKGSTPRKAATRMLIKSNGDILGSIGGGRLEAEVLEGAKTLYEKPDSLLLDISMTGKEVAETEMICGGQARIFLEFLTPEALTIVRELYDKLFKKEDAFFLTWIDKKQRPFEETHYIFEPTGIVEKISKLSNAITAKIEKAIKRRDVPSFIPHPEGEGFLFLEPLKLSSTLYIFGGGHISLDLAWMAERVDFQVIIVDDRKAFANRDRFPMASEVWAIPYKDALKNVGLGYNDFVVIVTRGHLFDLDILREVIVQSPEYIGMIGSRRKKAMIFQQLRNEGIPQKRLDEVHAPIGLNIRSETPAEISVSIIAEMILARAERK